MKTSSKALLAISGSLLTTTVASAHVALSGPAFANTTWESSFSVGHGCNGADTYSVTVDIPVGVTSVRAVNGSLGKAFTVKDTAGNVTSITWTKEVADVLPTDADFYRLPFRLKLPNTPFAPVYFPAHQVCRDSLGNISVVDWVGIDQTTALPDGAPPPEPAPSVVLLPARTPGWNKFTVGQHVTNLTIFNDSEIVWAGNAAYSVNPNYKTLIGTEPDTVALTEILAGTDIWVKY